MTVSRTIPENPQPGERYAVRNTSNGRWSVCIAEDDDAIEPRPFAFVQDEADARLLVFGAKAVEALKFVVAHECRDTPCIECYNKCRNALTDQEGNRERA